MVMPERHSAACCVTAPSKVTGAAAPANGIETISAGIAARARAINWPAPKLDQINGGDGQTSKMARGCSRNLSRPPAKMASISIM
jgi:hypothetical protein